MVIVKMRQQIAVKIVLRLIWNLQGRNLSILETPKLESWMLMVESFIIIAVNTIIHSMYAARDSSRLLEFTRLKIKLTEVFPIGCLNLHILREWSACNLPTMQQHQILALIGKWQCETFVTLPLKCL